MKRIVLHFLQLSTLALITISMLLMSELVYADTPSDYDVICTTGKPFYVEELGGDLSFTAFKEEIKVHLKQGWALQGGVSAFRATSKSGWYTQYCQAMVK